jgi:hypothetical protein
MLLHIIVETGIKKLFAWNRGGMEAGVRGLSHECLDVLRAHQVLKNFIFYRNGSGYPTFLILPTSITVRVITAEFFV